MSNTDAQPGGVQLMDADALPWNIRTEDMPAEMRVLLSEYPRESWQTHAGFREKTEQWLGAHQMFKRVIATVRKDTEDYLDGNKPAQEYISRLAYRGGALINNLHGHHGWEDHSYFPELSAADSRFDAGLAILEKDHATLDQVLVHFAEVANCFIQYSHLDNPRARDEAGALHSVTEIIETLLQRHLGDEEELAVPIILHHRLRG